MVQPGNDFFNDYCNRFRTLADDVLQMDRSELMSTIDDLPEIAKQVAIDDNVFILVVPDLASMGPNLDQITDGISCAFFFMLKMSPKKRIDDLQKVMNDTMEKALQFRNETQKITNTCNWLERLDWTTMTLSPFFNLSELYGWGMELKLSL